MNDKVDYVFEVEIEGEPDPESGEVFHTSLYVVAADSKDVGEYVKMLAAEIPHPLVHIDISRLGEAVDLRETK